LNWSCGGGKSMFLGTNNCVCHQVSTGMFMPHAVERRKTAFSSRMLKQPSNTTYSSTCFHTSTTTLFSQPIDPKKLIITNISSSNSHEPFIKNSETKMGLLDLEKHFAFYGAYHSNPINVAIHILFVWPILFTAQIILYFTPTLLSLGFLPPVLVLNWGFFATVFYALFYMALDIKAGSFTAFLTFFCWVASSFVANTLGYSLAWKVLNTNSRIPFKVRPFLFGPHLLCCVFVSLFSTGLIMFMSLLCTEFRCWIKCCFLPKEPR